MTEVSSKTYDEFPYACYAYAPSHPDRLAVVARLFGMAPPPLAGARVLELGCGNGANLIPMAQQAPDATFDKLTYFSFKGHFDPASPLASDAQFLDGTPMLLTPGRTFIELPRTQDPITVS